ncbi:unnamed protein product [Caenorhabditis nigoni]
MLGEDNHVAPQPFEPFLGSNGRIPMNSQNYDFGGQAHQVPSFNYHQPEPMVLAPDVPLNHSGFGIGSGDEEIMNEFFIPQRGQALQGQDNYSHHGSNLSEVRQNAHEAIDAHCDIFRKALKRGLEEVYGQELGKLKFEKDLLEKQVKSNMEMRQREEQWGQVEIDRLRGQLTEQEGQLRSHYEEKMKAMEKTLTEEFGRKIREVQESEERLKGELELQREQAKLREEQLNDVLGRSEAATKTAEFHHGVCQEKLPEWRHSSESVLNACINTQTKLEEMIKASST